MVLSEKVKGREGEKRKKEGAAWEESQRTNEQLCQRFGVRIGEENSQVRCIQVIVA